MTDNTKYLPAHQGISDSESLESWIDINRNFPTRCHRLRLWSNKGLALTRTPTPSARTLAGEGGAQWSTLTQAEVIAAGDVPALTRMLRAELLKNKDNIPADLRELPGWWRGR